MRDTMKLMKKYSWKLMKSENYHMKSKFWPIGKNFKMCFPSNSCIFIKHYIHLTTTRIYNMVGEILYLCTTQLLILVNKRKCTKMLVWFNSTAHNVRVSEKGYWISPTSAGSSLSFTFPPLQVLLLSNFLPLLRLPVSLFRFSCFVTLPL